MKMDIPVYVNTIVCNCEVIMKVETCAAWIFLYCGGEAAGFILGFFFPDSLPASTTHLVDLNAHRFNTSKIYMTGWVKRPKKITGRPRTHTSTRLFGDVNSVASQMCRARRSTGTTQRRSGWGLCTE